MTCPACGRDNRPGARFCSECGTALAVRCGACGNDLPAGARFCDSCGASVGEPTATAAPAPAVSRKVVSIVFADLQGSTALQETLDAESVRRLMDDFYAALRSAVEAHGGTVVKFIGDGVMAAFGVGEVSEDDAWRAVQAAAAMQNAFSALGWRAEVGLRVGVNTGEVIVTEGDADVVGDAVNVAARLESAAGRGRILVGEETWRLTRHEAAYEAVEPLVLRGKSDPVPAWRFLGFGSGAVEATAPFVGRDVELDQLIAVFDDAVNAGAARLATVIGSPGLGKSRLGTEFVAAVADRATVVATRCTAASASTFAPVADGLRSVGLDENDVRNALSGSPQETFLAVRRLLEILAATQPVVLLVDDVHWAEPLLLDLLQHLVEWTRTAPLMVLALARPEVREVRPALVETGRRVAAVVVLEGLTAEAGERLACDLLDTDHLPRALVDRVLAASEGNPLFVRELVRMLVDDRILVRDGGEWRSSIDVEAIDVPPTIQSLLAARIERLPAAERTVLERAAVVGREFYRGAVAELVPQADRHDLDTHLERLRQKDLVEPEGTYWIDEPVLRFHHVLLRDAAYRRLLKEVRADLHERHAGWLEAKGGDGVGDDVIGYHLEQAHGYRVELGASDEETVALGSRAADRLSSAGRQALDRDDLRTAAGLLGRALACLGPADERRADLLIDRCEALIATGALGTAGQALDELEQLASGSPRLDAWSASFSAQLAILTDPERLLETATDVSAAAARFVELGDTAGAAKAHAVHASALARLGRIGECEAALDRALAAARQAGDSRRATAVLAGAPLAALWGPSPVPRASGRCLDVVRVLRITTGATTVEATSLRCQAVLEALRGRTDASRRMLGAARRSLEELGHRHGLLSTEMFAGLVELLADDPAAAEAPLREATAGFKELGVDADAAQAAALLARALLAQGRVDEAEALTYDSEKLGGADLKTAIAWRAARAEALARRGALDHALELARAAVALAASTDALLDQADTHLALATVLALAGRAAEAQTEARQAVELYERKSATVLVQKATSLLTGAGAPRPTKGPSAKPRRRVRPNLLTRASAQAEAALRAQDPEAFARVMAPDAITRDHVLQVERPSGAGDMTVIAGLDSEVLATLGDRHGLARCRVLLKGEGTGPAHVEDLRAQRCDSSGRLLVSERFAPSDLNMALARLLELYAEDEAPPTRRAMLMASAAMLRNLVSSLEGLRLMPEHAVLVDHRPASLGTLEGRTNILAATDALAEVAGDLTSRTVDVLGLTDEVQLLEYVVEALGAEFPLIVLARLGPDGIPERLEWFPPEQREAALARFDELCDATPGERPLHNAAIDTAERTGVSVAHSLANGEAIESVEHVPLAVLGERLALLRSRYTGADGGGSPFEVEVLTVVEVDDESRTPAVVSFDPGDLKSAVDVLDERYMHSDELPHPGVWSVAHRWVSAYNHRRWDELAALVHPAFEVVDHRPAGWGTAQASEFLELTKSFVERAPDAVMYGRSVPLITERGWVGEVVVVGDIEGNGTYGLIRAVLALVEHDRLLRLELFPPEDLDVAAARLREYSEAGTAIRAGRFDLDNLAVGHLRAIEHMKWPEVKERFSPDLCLADRRAGIGLTVTGEEAFANLQLISEATTLSEVEPVAIRGNLLSLQRMRFGAGSAHEWEMLHLLEVDHDGRARFEASYDVDQVDAAFAELDDRYEEGEGAPFAGLHALGRRAYALWGERAWDELEGLFADDGVMIDRRPLGWGEVTPAEFVHRLRTFADMFSEATLREIAVVRATPEASLALMHGRGRAFDGGEIEIPFYGLLEWDGELLTRIEFLDADDVRAAISRFDEVVGRPTELLTNAASRALAELGRVIVAGDSEAIGNAFTADAVLDDRRHGLHNVVTGRAAIVTNYRAMSGVAEATGNTIATRGDRLVLETSRLARPPSFEVELLNVAEVNQGGELVAMIQFDAEDVDAAFAELDRRFIAGQTPSRAPLLEWMLDASTAFNRRDWPAYEAPFHQDLVMVDHRPLGWGTLDRDGWLRTIRAAVDMAPDSILRVVAIPAVTDHGIVVVVEQSGTIDGAYYEVQGALAAHLDKGMVTRLAYFPADDLNAALRELDAQLPGSQPPPHMHNLATATGDRLIERTLAHDAAGVADQYAPGGRLDDRRSGLATVVTGAEGLALSARAMAGVTSAEVTPLATRGERLSLSRVLWRGGDQFEVETLNLIEASPDGLVLANVVFDPVDLDAAFDELDARYVAGEGTTAPTAWAALQEALSAHNSSDPAGLAAHTSELTEAVDHRTLGRGTLEGKRFSAASDVVAWGAGMRCVALLRLQPHGLVALLAMSGEAPHGGGGWESEFVVLAELDGMQTRRLEFFDAEDLPRAVAKFDDLPAAPTTIERVLTNRAVAVSRRVARLQLADDRDEVASAHTKDVFVDDRRRNVRISIRGRARLDELLDLQQTVDEIHVEPLATRGERLCLARTRLLGTADEGGRFEVEVHEVVEIDEQDRIKAEIVFDPDPVARADEAMVELNRRFAEGEGAINPGAMALGTGILDSIARRDWAAFESYLSPDAVFVDHRAMGWATRDRGEYMDSLRDLVAMAPDIASENLALPKISPRGTVGVWRFTGTYGDGSRFENVRVMVLLNDGALITRAETFNLEDLDAALARFDELTADSAASNAAHRVSDEVLRCLIAKDSSAFGDLLADDAILDDRRPGMRSVVSGRDALLANFRRMFGVNETESECIATTGDRLALCRLRWRGNADDAQFEVECLCLTELDGAGKGMAFALYDVAGRADAIQEMADRFRAGEGVEYPVTTELSFSLGNYWRDREWEQVAALFAPGALVVDQRPLGWGAIAVDEFIDRARALTQIAPDAHIEGVAMPRFDARGSVSLLRGTGVTDDGSAFEMTFAAVILVDEGRIGRFELYPFEELDAAVARFDSFSPAG